MFTWIGATVHRPFRSACCVVAMAGATVFVLAGCAGSPSNKTRADTEPNRVQEGSPANGNTAPVSADKAAGPAHAEQPGSKPEVTETERRAAVRNKTERRRSSAEKGQGERATVAEAVTVPDQPPEPVFRPTVIMSHAHAATCLVKVGDPMPDMKLPELSGPQRPLSSLYGERLTVVVFWANRKVFAREQFLRLESEVVQPYRNFGVNVVAVNVGDSPEIVDELYRRAETTFSSLLDADGAAFARMATDKLPRTYLLDAQGRVLWLDIEYSRSTRRELRNAIHFFLRGGGPSGAADG